MPYTTTTLASAAALVAARLADPGFIHWSAPELTGDVIEALRTWGALTASFRDTGTFTTVGAPGPFYDLSVLLPASVRGLTVTDADLVTQLDYHLLEPPTPTSWTGSAQFTLADLVGALERRRDRFVLETGAILTRTLNPVIGPPPDGRIPLDERIATIRRAAWILTDGTVSPLQRDDEWGLTHFQTGWVQNPVRPPVAYSVGVTPPLVLQVAPPPLDTGTLDLIAVNRGATLDPTVPTVLGIPDDWSWVVKFGALADLFGRDGLALDPVRASYCEARWRHGIFLAAQAPTILAARIDNVPVRITSLTDADQYRSGWQTTRGVPTDLLVAGQNLIALAPPPDPAVGGYGVTVEVVANTPIPSLSGFLPVGPELLGVIVDYAQHLALLKEGPDQLVASQPLLDRFLRAAGVTMGLTRASVPQWPALQDQATRDERVRARITPAATPEPEGAAA